MDGRTDPLEIREELALTLLAGYLHDVNSPLAALQTNVGIARELLEDVNAGAGSVAELREVVVDLDAAAARLLALAADLRGYVGTAGVAPVAGQVGAAVRLARAHLSRRAIVDVRVDPTLRATLASGEVTRALGGILVAMTRGLQGPHVHRVTITSEPNGLLVSIDPPPPFDVADDLRAALLRLPEVPFDLRSTEAALTLHVGLSWAPA